MMNPYQIHMPYWPVPPLTEPPGAAAERTYWLLNKLGHPERHVPPVIHVGGTKGKGSIIAFLRFMLEAAGYRVHVYTSPHLARFNERIVLAGTEIDDGYLHQILEETRHAAGDFPLAFFDATTAAAFLAFRRVPADILLIEMGLGGALDATNVIEKPLLTVMTTISYDHMDVMGSTLPEIARYEAGLFKPHVPCIVSYQHDAARAVLRDEARKLATPLYEYGPHFQTRAYPDHMLFADSHGEQALPLPTLLGAHQVVNAGAAIAAISALEHFDVPPQAVVEGLCSARWKGRLEHMRTDFLPPECEVWFDGGHNGAAAQVIAQFVREHWVDKPFYFLFSTTRGKETAPMVEPFAALAKAAFGATVKSEPNSLSATEAAQALKPFFPEAQTADSIHAALHAIRRQEAGAFRLLVFGSLYFYLEASQL